MKSRSLIFAVVVLFFSASAEAAFLVEQFDNTGPFGNVQDAINAISGATPDSTVEVDVINFSDSDFTQLFPNDNPFPSAGNFDPNDPLNTTFVVRVTGLISVAADGNYTFGTRNDDGVRLTIDGDTVINSPGPQPPTNNFGTVDLTAGLHAVEIVLYENFGVAQLEFFTVDAAGDFQLVQAAEVPEPGTVAIWSVLGLIGVGGVAWRKQRRHVA